MKTALIARVWCETAEAAAAAAAVAAHVAAHLAAKQVQLGFTTPSTSLRKPTGAKRSKEESSSLHSLPRLRQLSAIDGRRNSAQAGPGTTALLGN